MATSLLDAGQVLPHAFDDATQALRVSGVAGSLVTAPYDYIVLSYTGSNLTGVVYKTSGSGGTTVATLVLTYDGSNNLTSVTKT